ncbi:general odorant-binding protein 56d-like [Leptopilina heterotoma]|uniref:general odorant-binding protein 56d-like n=1 Tax=Leptopilina heterotoma TaxID=63436 RepID=UPI001CA9C0D2|nr:general odorant-binding protein 56d-like [Leptopilina heterotoma]
MKATFAILTLCIVGALAGITEEQKTKLAAYKTECIKESGVDAAVVQNARDGKIDDNDKKLACFSACLLKKIGIMNPDGTINEEVARAKIPDSIPKDKANEVINKCKVLKGADECETGYKVMKCYMQTKTFSIL